MSQPSEATTIPIGVGEAPGAPDAGLSTPLLGLAPIPEHVGPAEAVKRLRPVLIAWLVLSALGLFILPLSWAITGDVVARTQASADIVIITYLSTPGCFGEVLAVVVVALMLAYNEDLSPSRAQVVVVLSGLASILSAMNVVSVGITYIRALIMTASNDDLDYAALQAPMLHDAADHLVRYGYPLALLWFIVHSGIGAYVTNQAWHIAKLAERIVRP